MVTLNKVHIELIIIQLIKHDWHKIKPWTRYFRLALELMDLEALKQWNSKILQFKEDNYGLTYSQAETFYEFFSWNTGFRLVMDGKDEFGHHKKVDINPWELAGSLDNLKRWLSKKIQIVAYKNEIDFSEYKKIEEKLK